MSVALPCSVTRLADFGAEGTQIQHLYAEARNPKCPHQRLRIWVEPSKDIVKAKVFGKRSSLSLKQASATHKRATIGIVLIHTFMITHIFTLIYTSLTGPPSPSIKTEHLNLLQTKAPFGREEITETMRRERKPDSWIVEHKESTDSSVVGRPAMQTPSVAVEAVLRHLLPLATIGSGLLNAESIPKNLKMVKGKSRAPLAEGI
ncbi:hypothetical protein EDD85DRAFT_797235 [Armillaria nabsnona]|nr:hypothetical protein EDD85DRAFT_797235 [Armillaria nabsnona]